MFQKNVCYFYVHFCRYIAGCCRFSDVQFGVYEGYEGIDQQVKQLSSTFFELIYVKNKKKRGKPLNIIVC